MIWAAAEALGLRYERCVQLFQSQLFEDEFPEDNRRYQNVQYVDAVDGDRAKSLTHMRRAMLSSEPFEAAVFIGGMEGLFEEYELFRDLWPRASVVAIPSPGGTAAEIYELIGENEELRHAIDYSAWLYELLSIRADEERRTFFQRG
jgi:hypothetical protein